MHTLQESTRKVDTGVSIPRPTTDVENFPRNAGCIQLLQTVADTILIAETDDDLRHTE
jgi:hypothetical protein